MKNYFLPLLILIFFTGCDKSVVFEKSEDLDKNGWSDTKVLNFDFSITNSNERYKFLYNVRYTNDFQNYNLYVKHSLLDSNGRQISALLQGMDLFKPTSGEPYGKGLGGTYDYLILSKKDLKFPYNGRYSIQVRQYMRQPLLKGIEAFGIRIEHDIP